jgi:hypothetical protein
MLPISLRHFFSLASCSFELTQSWQFCLTFGSSCLTVVLASSSSLSDLLDWWSQHHWKVWDSKFRSQLCDRLRALKYRNRANDWSVTVLELQQRRDGVSTAISFTGYLQLSVRADQQHNTLTRGASKGSTIWVDVIADALHIQVK